MSVLDTSSNNLNGKIPESLQNLKYLRILNFGRNHFTSTVPAALSSIKSLEYLNLANNLLSNAGGSWSFVNVTAQSQLSVVDLTNNLFQGSPLPLFSLPALRYFFASSNCFSGALDSRVCTAASLERLVMDGMSSSKNCLANYFPDQSTQRQNDDDGDDDEVLQRVESNQQSRAFQFRFDGKYSRQQIGGTIPSCVWSLPRLESLQLSGNAHSGSLPQTDFNFSSSLTKLVIRSNKLSNVIPAQLLSRLSQFAEVDLGYNRFRGDYSAIRIKPSSTIKFSANNNRISGPVPSDLVALAPPAQLMVLDGNLLSCPENQLEWSLLFETDPYSSNYQCGSAQFDRYFWTLLGASCSMWLAWLIFSRAKPTATAVAKPAIANAAADYDDATLILPFLRELFDVSLSASWASLRRLLGRVVYSSSPDEDLRSTTVGQRSPVVARFIRELDDLKVLSLFAMALFLLLFIPVYGILSVVQSDLLDSYSYAVSAAYKEGVSATVVLFFIWWLSVLANAALFSLAFGSRRQQLDFLAYSRNIRRSALEIKARVGSSYHYIQKLYKEQRIEAAQSGLEKPRLVLRLIIIVCINVLSAMVVNLVFVYLMTLQSTTKFQQVLLKLSLAAFKLANNSLFIPTTLKSRWLQLGVERATILRAGLLRGGDVFHVGLVIFNFIVAPCIALAMVDSNCFRAVITEPPGVETEYTVVDTIPFAYFSVMEGDGGQLQVLPNGIDEEHPAITSRVRYRPTFSYAYQCSSTVIVLYAPVFLLTCIISSLLPLCKNWLWRRLLDALGRWQAGKSGGPGAALATGVVDVIPASASPAPAQAPSPTSSFLQQLLPRLRALLILSSPKGYLTAKERLWRDQQKLQAVLDQRLHVSTFDEIHDSMVNVRAFYRQTLNDFVLLVTFGVACPMLGLAVGLSIVFRVTRWKRMMQALLAGLEAGAAADDAAATAAAAVAVGGPGSDGAGQARPSSDLLVPGGVSHSHASKISNNNNGSNSGGAPPPAGRIASLSRAPFRAVSGYSYDCAEETALLEEDVLVANGGDKNTHPLYTSRWFVLLLCSVFFPPFLVDTSQSPWPALAFVLAVVLPFGLRKLAYGRRHAGAAVTPLGSAAAPQDAAAANAAGAKMGKLAVAASGLSAGAGDGIESESESEGEVVFSLREMDSLFAHTANPMLVELAPLSQASHHVRAETHV